METQAFWNKRDAELMEATNRQLSPSEQLAAKRNKLANMDSIAMREAGLDDQAAIKALRSEIEEMEAAIIKPAGWTKEETIARRAGWNARVKSGEFAAKPGKPTAVQVVAAEKLQGWTVADLKKFVGQWGLA